MNNRETLQHILEELKDIAGIIGIGGDLSELDIESTYWCGCPTCEDRPMGNPYHEIDHQEKVDGLGKKIEDMMNKVEITLDEEAD